MTAVTAAGSATDKTTSLTSTKSGETEDRFLKLLVAQMNNQDPLNPLDNAQVTSQMAQISTVNGIEKLNTTMSSLMTQFSGLQTMQGAGLIGHSVLVEGNGISLSGGQSVAAFDLKEAAKSVKVDILDSHGAVIESVDLGAMDAGRHPFSWDGELTAGGTAADGQYRFRVTAKDGATPIESTTLTAAKVLSVSNTDSGLQLDLQNVGLRGYDEVKSIF